MMELQVQARTQDAMRHWNLPRNIYRAVSAKPLVLQSISPLDLNYLGNHDNLILQSSKSVAAPLRSTSPKVRSNPLITYESNEVDLIECVPDDLPRRYRLRSLRDIPRLSTRIPCDCPCAIQPLPLPRGPPEQLALQPSQEDLWSSVLGLHGHRLLRPLRYCRYENVVYPLTTQR